MVERDAVSLDETLPASLESVLDPLREFLEACLEVDAVRALTEALSAKQYEILGHPFSLTVEGRIASAVHARDPSGRELWALVEAKPRLRAADIPPWARTLREPGYLAYLELSGLQAPMLAYAFGLVLYSDAKEAAREHGIGLLTPLGELVEPGPPIEAL